MLYHCDSLLPAEGRYSSAKFRRLSRWFDPYKIDKAYLLELTIFCTTPGLTINHVGLMMQWDHNMMVVMREVVVPHYEAEALPYTRDNLMSITEDDGRAMLVSILDGNPNRSGLVPLYVTRYLQRQRELGYTARQIAQQFKTTPRRIRSWWNADVFDPLSAQRRPRHLVFNNRPAFSGPARWAI